MSPTSSLTLAWPAESTRRPSATSGDSSALSTASMTNSSTKRRSATPRRSRPWRPHDPAGVHHPALALGLGKQQPPALPARQRPRQQMLAPRRLRHGPPRTVGQQRHQQLVLLRGDDRRPGGRVGLALVLPQPRDPGGDQDALEVALVPQLPAVR